MSDPTSARMFDRQSDSELAQWLDNDANVRSGRAGQNNHVAACRAAAERLRERPALVARAEAAEAVIAAVEAEVSSWEQSPRGEVAPTRGVGKVFRAILSAAPQTVLAERDRKNREAAWAEGAKWAAVECGAIKAEQQGWLARGDNPYTEKEQE